jgi:hypothetical protein
MPTIRAVFPVVFHFDIELSRDFSQNVKYQLADAVYQRLVELEEADAIDFLRQAIVEIGEGKPIVLPVDSE